MRFCRCVGEILAKNLSEAIIVAIGEIDNFLRMKYDN